MKCPYNNCMLSAELFPGENKHSSFSLTVCVETITAYSAFFLQASPNISKNKLKAVEDKITYVNVIVQTERGPYPRA